MITDIFGKPGLPNIINDCNLVIEKDDIIYIGKVYIFAANHLVQIIKFGDFWSYYIFKEKRIVGYFSSPENRIQLPEQKIYKIIGKMGGSKNYINCQIDGVSFTRTHHSISQSGSRHYIKFLAKNIIYDYK